MLYPLPAEIPTAELTSLVAAALLRREAIDVKKAAHTAWQLVGVGISEWIKMTGSDPVVAFAALTSAAATMSDDEAANILLNMHAVQGDTSQTIPWDLLVPVLIQLIERLFRGKP